METDSTLKALVDINVKVWADKRNTTVHEAAKIDVDNPRTWEEVVKDAKDCALEGQKLFDEYNNSYHVSSELIPYDYFPGARTRSVGLRFEKRSNYQKVDGRVYLSSDRAVICVRLFNNLK